MCLVSQHRDRRIKGFTTPRLEAKWCSRPPNNLQDQQPDVQTVFQRLSNEPKQEQKQNLTKKLSIQTYYRNASVSFSLLNL